MMSINKSFVQRKRENEKRTSSSATVIPGAADRGWMGSGLSQDASWIWRGMCDWNSVQVD